MRILQWLGIMAFAAALLPAQPPNPAALTPGQWKDDVAFLARELPRRHKNAFAYVSRASLEQQVAELEARIPNLSEGEIRAGIARLVAALGDAHTSIWGDGRPDAFHFLPVYFSLFQDGVFIIAAAPQYRGLLGGKLVRIGRSTVDEARRALAPYVAHDNDACLRANLPRALITAEFLYAAGVSEAPGEVLVEAQSAGGEPVSAMVRAVILSETHAGERAYTGEPPLSRRQSQESYWATLTGDATTVYFQYNKCNDDPQKPFAAFRSELRQLLARDSVQRLILDLRNNGGGDTSVLAPWVKEIRSSRFNRKGGLYVLIGRHTFSSAVYHATQLRDQTAATLVGEPTCGKPNQYGEVQTMRLPNSGIKVAYSTRYFKLRAVDEPCLMPDVTVEQTSKDFLAGIDSVLTAILR